MIKNQSTNFKKKINSIDIGPIINFIRSPKPHNIPTNQNVLMKDLHIIEEVIKILFEKYTDILEQNTIPKKGGRKRRCSRKGRGKNRRSRGRCIMGGSNTLVVGVGMGLLKLCGDENSDDQTKKITCPLAMLLLIFCLLEFLYRFIIKYRTNSNSNTNSNSTIPESVQNVASFLGEFIQNNNSNLEDSNSENNLVVAQEVIERAMNVHPIPENEEFYPVILRNDDDLLDNELNVLASIITRDETPRAIVQTTLYTRLQNAITRIKQKNWTGFLFRTPTSRNGGKPMKKRNKRSYTRKKTRTI